MLPHMHAPRFSVDISRTARYRCTLALVDRSRADWSGVRGSCCPGRDQRHGRVVRNMSTTHVAKLCGHDHMRELTTLCFSDLFAIIIMICVGASELERGHVATCGCAKIERTHDFDRKKAEAHRDERAALDGAAGKKRNEIQEKTHPARTSPLRSRFRPPPSEAARSASAAAAASRARAAAWRRVDCQQARGRARRR
jgi:hypothetical protein